MTLQTRPRSKRGVIHHCAYCGGQHPGNTCPNRTAETPNLVDVIIAERGVTKWTAYDILAKERKNGVDSWATRGLKRPAMKPAPVRPPVTPTEVPHNHKLAILLALAEFKKEARTLSVLRNKMIEMGFVSDDHSIAHVLWALQKDNLVRFSERKVPGGSSGSGMEHIALRPNGWAKVEDVRRKKHVDLDTSPVKESVEVADISEELGEPEAIPVIEEKTIVDEPAISSTVVYPSIKGGEFPLIKAIVDRQIKMNAAARLLEEAGQDDLAISVLEKAIYSPLEEEIIRLWRKVNM